VGQELSLVGIGRRHSTGLLLGFFWSLVGATLLSSTVYACGYHDPVNLGRGMMNWVYPNSLYVQTAVWQAEDAGVLPSRAAEPTKDLFAYQRIVQAMRAYGALITKADVAAGEMPNLSVVLIDTLLWTRFARAADAYAVEVHAEGPAPNDVVMVTAGKVMFSLVDGTLTPRIAYDRGLIRLYGPPAAVEMVKEHIDRIPVATRVPNEQFGGGR
jgi:hypothetical protein